MLLRSVALKVSNFKETGHQLRRDIGIVKLILLQKKMGNVLTSRLVPLCNSYILNGLFTKEVKA